MTARTNTTSHAYTCDMLGVCNGGTHCQHCTGAQPVASPATNFAANELPQPTLLTEQQDYPLDQWENMFFWSCVAVTSTASIAVLAGLCGWLVGTFAA